MPVRQIIEKQSSLQQLLCCVLCTCCSLIAGEPPSVVLVGAEGLRHYRNDGKGVFQAAGEALGQMATTGGTLADFNGDGRLDLVTSGRDGNPNVLWLDAKEKAQVMPSNHAWKVVSGDLDADGDQDLFFANCFDYSARVAIANEVWFNDGKGHFTRSDQVHAQTSSFDARLHDFDWDGDLDAFVVTQDGFDELWLNNGKGVFKRSAQQLGAVDGKGNGMGMGDVDGDGDMDILAAKTGYNVMYFNNGKGIFSEGQRLGDSDSTAADFADLDGDGDLDLFVTNRSQANRIWLNDGKGHFADTGQMLGEGFSLGIRLADFDGDGDQDALVANRHDRTNKENKATCVLWVNNGKGQFREGQKFGWARHRQVLLWPGLFNR